MQTNANLLKKFEWLLAGVSYKNINPVYFLPNPIDSLIKLKISILDNANCTDTLTQNIKILRPKQTVAGFALANVFTPNGDGINDEWQAVSEPKTNFYIQIYNRYGVLVFETMQWNKQWTAENNPDGVYFYNISFTDNNNQPKSVKGWVVVTR